MATQHQKSLKNLEKQITGVSNALGNLSRRDDFRRLIVIWRRPGFTTPAEILFLSGLVASMGSLTATLANLKRDLIKGSQAVRTGR